MRSPRTVLLVLATVLSLFPALGDRAAALSGKQPIVVVLCKFTDSLNEPQTSQFFQNLFSETGKGTRGIFDYWWDVSYGSLDLTGTIVKGWYTVPNTTLAQWQALSRAAKIDKCASQAVNVNFNSFAGVVVLTNQTGLSEDLFGGVGTTIGGQFYNIGFMDAEWDQPLAGILHETAHLFRLNHSRAVSTPNADYNDCYDLASVYSCANFVQIANGVITSGPPGPGLNATQVDTQAWFPGGRRLDFNNGSCGQQSIQLAALDHEEASGYLAARVPAARSIGQTTSDFYYVELRHRDRWDAGMSSGTAQGPADAVLLHLRGQDQLSYWVDQAPSPAFFVGMNPAMRPGSEYIDAGQNTYIAVNSIDPTGPTAVVTLGGCKINAKMVYVGQTAGDYTDAVTLAGVLTTTSVSPVAPIPFAVVTLTIGSQSCSAVTDLAGYASCVVTLNQQPGSYTAGASFPGDLAYNAASDSEPFTIEREDSQTTYTGALTQRYSDPFTASATLVDPDSSTPVPGRTIDFTLGAGDTCSAMTDGQGAASCAITPTQAAGTYAITAAFAGDSFYLPSADTRTFTIEREITVTTYTGPLVILAGQSVTLSGRVLEDDGPAVQGRTLTLALGAQNCSGITDANGDASCTISAVNLALGPQPISASFAGDAYYLPSADTGKTAIVFAFPSSGAFLLGDDTVASATPTTTVTWWDSSWSSLVELSSGDSPPAFKGYASEVNSLPTTTPPASCGGTWTTSGGSSAPPSDDVPSYMGVLVTSSVGKDGSTIAGSFSGIVVVANDPGYAPSAGHSGTGRIVATFCP